MKRLLREGPHGDEAITSPEQETEKSLTLELSSRVISLITYLTLIGAGVWCTAGAFHLGIGNLATPGPGFWPLIVGVAITVLTACLTLKGLSNKPGTNPQEESTSVQVSHSLSVWVVVILWAWLLHLFTFVVVSSAALFCLFKFIGRGSWIFSSTTAVAVSTVVYLLLGRILGVPLP